MNLSHKIAVVTGASKGLGASISQKLVEQECTVYGIGRDSEALSNVSKTLGDRFHPVVLDITQRDALTEWIEATFNELQPDILVNNAGFGFFTPIENVNPDEFDTLMRTNVTALYDCCRLMIPIFKRTSDVSYIMNIASIAGLMGNPQLTAYNASKFAVRGISQALMKEVRQDNIKVSCLFPGSISTHFFDTIEGIEPNDKMMHPDDVADTVLHLLHTPDNLLIDEITLRPLRP